MKLKFIKTVKMLLLIVFSLVTFILVNKKFEPNVHLCYVDPIPQPPNKIDDILLAAHKPPRGRSIFFIDTKCPKGLWKFHDQAIDAYLTNRQACSIESAALHNPNSEIFVLFANPTFWSNNTAIPFIDAMLSYPNVHLRNLNLWSYTENTPAAEWLQTRLLFTSKFLQVHTSDFLRFVTLWRFGGTYFDMDVVSLRSIEKLTPNFAGSQIVNINGAILNFEPDGMGHKITEYFLRDFISNFNGSNFGIGPQVTSRVLYKLCGTNNMTEMNRERCQHFEIYPTKAFYPIHYFNTFDIFNDVSLEDAHKSVNGSYVLHIWNAMAKEIKIRAGLQSLYGRIAREHCPKVYKLYGDEF